MTNPHLVLVVDDEEEIRDYLGTILEDEGFEVERAADGHRALELVRQRKPDFISLDLVMPDRSGMKFLYELRKDRELARIPILIVTGHARDDLGKGDMEELLEGRVLSGPGCYLEKPIRPESYVGAIRRRLGLEETEGTSLEDLRSQVKRLADAADPIRLEAAMRVLRGEGGKVASPVPETPETDATDLTGKRILVVDDEPDVAEYIAAILTDRGCEAGVATNSGEALALLEEGAFDLMTLDVDLPGKSGVDFYRELRADATRNDMRIVLITGVQREVEPLFEDESMFSPRDGYLAKPFEPAQLVEVVARTIGK
jgi:CheY-like chemotaxis protein